MRGLDQEIEDPAQGYDTLGRAAGIKVTEPRWLDSLQRRAVWAGTPSLV